VLFVNARWPGFYTDARGRDPVAISTDGHAFSMELRGVTFTGEMFDDMEPAVSPGADAPFTLHHGTLCACTLEWTMPVSLTTAAGERTAHLDCRLVLGAPDSRNALDREDLDLTLRHENIQVTTTRSHGWFEDALTDIQRQLPPGADLKACISCAFSDYHPAGSPLFRGMACFRDNQQAYLAVRSKRDIFSVYPTATEFVPETYLCPCYRRRGPRAGYRGGFPGP
jgi:hypothetical protein